MQTQLMGSFTTAYSIRPVRLNALRFALHSLVCLLPHRRMLQLAAYLWVQCHYAWCQIYSADISTVCAPSGTAESLLMRRLVMWAPCFGGTLSRGRFSSRTRRRRAATCSQLSETPVQPVINGTIFFACHHSPSLLPSNPESDDEGLVKEVTSACIGPHCNLDII